MPIFESRREDVSAVVKPPRAEGHRRHGLREEQARPYSPRHEAAGLPAFTLDQTATFLSRDAVQKKAESEDHEQDLQI
jgi:hypothetical protein